jgi:hypothetical protein
VRTRRFLAALLLLAFPSCVGLRQGRLPSLEREEVLRGEPAPAIRYRIDWAWLQGRSGCCFDWWDETARLFDEAFVEARPDSAENGLRVEIRFDEDERLPVLGIGSRALCLFSLGLVPAWSRWDRSMNARLELDGRLLREYRYDEEITAWSHILLLPLLWTRRDLHGVRHAVSTDMLLHLVRDLRRDLPALVAAEAGG